MVIRYAHRTSVEIQIITKGRSQSADTAARSAARFENRYSVTGIFQQRCCYKPGQSSSYNKNVLWMLRRAKAISNDLYHVIIH